MSKHLNKFALLALLLVAGCATQPARPVTQEAWARTDGIKYHCVKNRTFVASFAPDGSRAAIKLGETIYDVPRIEGDSVVHYQSDEIDYMGKGRNARLTKSPEGAYEGCTTSNS